MTWYVLFQISTHRESARTHVHTFEIDFIFTK